MDTCKSTPSCAPRLKGVSRPKETPCLCSSLTVGCLEQEKLNEAKCHKWVEGIWEPQRWVWQKGGLRCWVWLLLGLEAAWRSAHFLWAGTKKLEQRDVALCGQWTGSLDAQLMTNGSEINWAKVFVHSRHACICVSQRKSWAEILLGRKGKHMLLYWENVFMRKGDAASLITLTCHTSSGRSDRLNMNLSLFKQLKYIGCFTHLIFIPCTV